MGSWILYENNRWDLETCREIVAQLRASKKYSKVKIGAPRVYHGRSFYHVLVVE